MARVDRPHPRYRQRCSLLTRRFKALGKIYSPRKADCYVCEELSKICLAPIWLHKIVNLGSLDEVYSASTCKNHRRLLEAAVKSDNLAQEDAAQSFYATKLKDASGVTLELGFERDYWGAGTKSVLEPLQRTVNAFGSRSARLVDPKWIDASIIKGWKQGCDRLHGSSCSGHISTHLIDDYPAWLIDCYTHCLVPAKAEDSYLTLSYVWGGSKNSFLTYEKNIKKLQQNGSLISPNVYNQIPNTIRDAMLLTRLLDERYLWVDSLCIIQDDENKKQREISKMAAIYSNSALTIVACGPDASYGLKGLKGTLKRRSFAQECYKLRGGPRIILHEWHEYYTDPNVWKERGWTLQEYLLSRRCVMFQHETVRWECGQSVWNEDSRFECSKQVFAQHFGDESTKGKELLTTTFPRMELFGGIVAEYLYRKLSYPQDAHNAFAGVLAAFCRSFRGGFISGLPVILFDLALLWESTSNGSYRTSDGHTPNALPSWSWISWEGSFRDDAWHLAHEYLKSDQKQALGDPLTLTKRSTIRLVRWYVHHKGSPPERVHSIWYDYRQVYLKKNCSKPPPRGWKRHENLGRITYTHSSEPDLEFKYPIPLVDPAAERPVPRMFPLLSCHTRRAWLVGSSRVTNLDCRIHLRDQQGTWAGILTSQEEADIINDSAIRFDDIVQETNNENHSLFGKALELVEISRGSLVLPIAYDVDGPFNYRETVVQEWDHEERPERGPKYEFYNVLYIKWKGEFAYRRGSGRVEKGMWEAQNREWIDLTLN